MYDPEELSALDDIEDMLADFERLLVDGSGARIDRNVCSESLKKGHTFQQEKGQLAKRVFILIALERLHNGQLVLQLGWD